MVPPEDRPLLYWVAWLRTVRDPTAALEPKRPSVGAPLVKPSAPRAPPPALSIVPSAPVPGCVGGGEPPRAWTQERTLEDPRVAPSTHSSVRSSGLRSNWS